MLNKRGKEIKNELDRPFFLKTEFLDKFESGLLKSVDGDPDKIQKYEQSLEEEELELLIEESEEI